MHSFPCTFFLLSSDLSRARIQVTAILQNVSSSNEREHRDYNNPFYMRSGPRRASRSFKVRRELTIRGAPYTYPCRRAEVYTEIKFAKWLYKTRFLLLELLNHATRSFHPEATHWSSQHLGSVDRHCTRSRILTSNPSESHRSQLSHGVRLHTPFCGRVFSIATRQELLNVKQVGWMVTPNSCCEQATKRKGKKQGSYTRVQAK